MSQRIRDRLLLEVINQNLAKCKKNFYSERWILAIFLLPTKYRLGFCDLQRTFSKEVQEHF